MISKSAPGCASELLEVQRLEKASGTAQADSSYDLLEVWNLKQHMKALVFDTTASNIGWNNSAAKCLESLKLQMMPISNVFKQSGNRFL